MEPTLPRPGVSPGQGLPSAQADLPELHCPATVGPGQGCKGQAQALSSLHRLQGVTGWTCLPITLMCGWRPRPAGNRVSLAYKTKHERPGRLPASGPARPQATGVQERCQPHTTGCSPLGRARLRCGERRLPPGRACECWPACGPPAEETHRLSPRP